MAARVTVCKVMTIINEDGHNLVLKFGPGELQRVIVDGTKCLKMV